MIEHRLPKTWGGRHLVRRVHLLLGLSLGLLFALVGLTGSVLVFYTSIDASLNPVLQTERSGSAADWRSPVWDRVLATGRRHRHDVGGKWTLEVTGGSGTIPARYYPAPGQHADREMIWFSADGARIVRAEPWGGYPMSWIYRLHMELLAGDTGRQLVGWSGVFMLLLLISGVFAWWPRASWRKALGFKRDAGPVRRMHDIHKLSGLGSALVLLVLVASGVLLALPVVTRYLIAPAVIPTPKPNGIGEGRITVARALMTAQSALPDGRLTFVDVPNARTAPLRMRFQVAGDPHPRFPSSYVFVDQFTGRLLAVYDVRRGDVRTKVTSWIRTLHDGTVGGTATRVLVLLTGLAPTILVATGMARWLGRRRRITCSQARRDDARSAAARKSDPGR